MADWLASMHIIRGVKPVTFLKALTHFPGKFK